MPCFIKASNTGIESDVFVRCVLQSAFVGIRFNSYLSYSECFFLSQHICIQVKEDVHRPVLQYTTQGYKGQLPHQIYTKGSKKKKITCRSPNPLLAENSKNPHRRGSPAPAFATVLQNRGNPNARAFLKQAAIEEANTEKPISRGRAPSTPAPRPELAVADDRHCGNLEPNPTPQQQQDQQPPPHLQSKRPAAIPSPHGDNKLRANT